MKPMYERVLELGPKDQEIFCQMSEDIMEMLESENDAAVLMLDKQGDGNSVVITAGNIILVEPLMRAAGAIATNIFSQPEGYAQ